MIQIEWTLIPSISRLYHLVGGLGGSLKEAVAPLISQRRRILEGGFNAHAYSPLDVAILRYI
jgi:hypothetical protein